MTLLLAANHNNLHNSLELVFVTSLENLTLSSYMPLWIQSWVFPSVIQRIAYLTHIWLYKYCLNTHYRQAQVVSLHICRAFLLSAFQSVLPKLHLCAKPAHPPPPRHPVSSRVPMPFPPFLLGEERQVYTRYFKKEPTWCNTTNTHFSKSKFNTTNSSHS